MKTKQVVLIGTQTGKIYYTGDECSASRYLIEQYPSLVESDALRRDQRYPKAIYDEPLRKYGSLSNWTDEFYKRNGQR